MGKSAMSKFLEADELDKQAQKIVKRDPESCRQIKELARKKRRSAIRQMNRRPKKRGAGATSIIR